MAIGFNSHIATKCSALRPPRTEEAGGLELEDELEEEEGEEGGGDGLEDLEEELESEYFTRQLIIWWIMRPMQRSAKMNISFPNAGWIHVLGVTK
jgi:hypothetical protein